MRLLNILAGGLFILAASSPADAQTVWTMATEYPQGAMSGVGLTTFAAHIAASSGGKLVIQPSFDAARGIRSADMLNAVAQDRVQAGDAFAGSLGAEDAIFALPSLPDRKSVV